MLKDLLILEKKVFGQYNIWQASYPSMQDAVSSQNVLEEWGVIHHKSFHCKAATSASAWLTHSWRQLPVWLKSNKSTPEQFIPFQNTNNSNYRHNIKLKWTHFRHSHWSWTPWIYSLKIWMVMLFCVCVCFCVRVQGKSQEKTGNIQFLFILWNIL